MSPDEAIEIYGALLVRELADERSTLIGEAGDVSDADEQRFAGSWMLQEIQRIQEERLGQGNTKLEPATVDALRQFVVDTAFHGAQIWRVWKDHPNATNMWVNGTDPVVIELEKGQIIVGPSVAKSDAELVNGIRAMRAKSSRPDDPWDHTNHALEFVIEEDGTRVTAISYVTKQPFVTFRRPTFLKVTLDDLVGNNTLSRECATFLDAAVQARFRILIGGSMNTGKTVLLRALASSLPKNWITVTAESQAELLLDESAGAPYPNFIVPLEARKAGADGSGAIILNTLIQDAQRMSPQCVIVGEIRGAEAEALAKSVTQGYMVMSTIHGYSASHSVGTAALYLEQFTDMDADAALRRIADGIDLAIFMDVIDGQRTVTEVRSIENVQNGVLKHDAIFDHAGVMVDSLPESVQQRFDRFGIDPRQGSS